MPLVSPSRRRSKYEFPAHGASNDVVHFSQASTRSMTDAAAESTSAFSAQSAFFSGVGGAVNQKAAKKTSKKTAKKTAEKEQTAAAKACSAQPGSFQIFDPDAQDDIATDGRLEIEITFMNTTISPSHDTNLENLQHVFREILETGRFIIKSFMMVYMMPHEFRSDDTKNCLRVMDCARYHLNKRPNLDLNAFGWLNAFNKLQGVEVKFYGYMMLYSEPQVTQYATGFFQERADAHRSHHK
jgi:hypothetical protein